MFRPAYESAVDLAKIAFRKFFDIVIEVVMETFGDTGKQVMGFLRKAGDTITTIARDPVKFVKNLIDAVILGFKNFAGNFLTHLKDSLMDFLFGEVGSRIKPPKEFSLPAVFSLVLDVLDLNYAHFRKLLVDKTSPEAVTVLEGAFDTIQKMAQAKSLSAAWDVFKQQAGDMISELVGVAIDKIKSWVVTNVVQKAIEKVLQMFTPASAVIAAIEAIYHTIKTLIEKGKQLLAVLQATVDSISRIAAGDLTQAAEKIEGAMSKALNFIVAFLAEQAGIGGIGQTIRDIIKAIKDKVDGVINKVLDFVVGKAKGLLERAKATAGKVLAWWQQRKEMIIGGEEHAVYMEGSEDDAHLTIASTPMRWADYLNQIDPKKLDQKKKDLLQKTKADVAKVEAKLQKGATEGSAQVKEKREAFDRICVNLAKFGMPKKIQPISSKPQYGAVRAADGVATKATIDVLSSLVKAGSEPSENSKAWDKLEPIRGEKHYIRGHLLNHNLGGEGTNENLTPINIAANNKHKTTIENPLKDKVKKDGTVVFYEVKAIYGKHDEGKPKRMLNLETQEADLQAKGKALPDSKKALLEAYRTEQKLCTRFDYEWYELEANQKGEWVNRVPAKSGDPKNKGSIEHEIDIGK